MFKKKLLTTGGNFNRIVIIKRKLNTSTINSNFNDSN